MAKVSRRRKRDSPETLRGKGVSGVMLFVGSRSRLSMPLAPLEYTLELIPRARVDVIDVRQRVSERFGDALDSYKRVLCCSFHTTAGYLDQSLASRLNQSRTGVMPYIELFRTMFPGGRGIRARQNRAADRTDRGTAARRTAERRFPPCVHGGRAAHVRLVHQPDPGAHVLHRSRWCSRRQAPAPGHERDRLLARRARRSDAADRSGFPLRGRLGEPQGAGARHLR